MVVGSREVMTIYESRYVPSFVWGGDAEVVARSSKSTFLRRSPL